MKLELQRSPEAITSGGAPEDDKPVKVAIRASNGQYVSAEDGGKKPLQANRKSIGTWETFDMYSLGGTHIALKAVNGKYVANENNGDKPLIADRSKIGEWEIFDLEMIDERHAGLKASNGKWVCNCDNGKKPLQANGEKLSSWEIFEVLLLDAKGKPVESKSVQVKSDNRRSLSSQSKLDAYTVCFSGTACTRDEGEAKRKESDPAIYAKSSGYIPVRIHKEISGNLKDTSPSVAVRGVGENDWASPRKSSEKLKFSGPLHADSTLLSYVKGYSGGNQYSKTDQLTGWPAPALALHGANMAADSGAKQYNFIGHSRGAVEGIMAAWFLYAYGPKDVKDIPVNIFAIDPVPGSGEWYSILTQLPPNVKHFVGVYSWDHSLMPADRPFSAVVPRPNGRMIGKSNSIKLTDYWYWPWNKWKYLADDSQQRDPLKPGNHAQPKDYELWACRGRHSTVSGNATSNAEYNPKDVSDNVAPVPELVYKMARAYLTKWGTTFEKSSAVKETTMELRQHIHTFHREFDAMGGGATRNSILPDRPYVRRVSSIYGINPNNYYFMDDVVGDPPYLLSYPVTKDRKNTGWVNWKFL
ncbi:MAG: hypothetical protein ACFB10_22965 [Salibacteraceae bacterium]